MLEKNKKISEENIYEGNFHFDSGYENTISPVTCQPLKRDRMRTHELANNVGVKEVPH